MKKLILFILLLLIGGLAYLWITKQYIFEEKATLTDELQVSTDPNHSELPTEQALPASETDTPNAAVDTHKEEEKASVKLAAYGFNSAGLRMKLNNTTEPTDRARNVVQVKSTFVIAAEPSAASGERTVYLQIINPAGEVLSTRNNSTFKDTEGIDHIYSGKRNIEYNKEAVEVSVYYDFNGLEALKGDYKVNIFCDGYLIGSDSFSLR